MKQKIIDSLHSSLFQDFLSGKITRGIFVIGVVPHLITNFFQCKCRFLLLSPYTVLKTITKHKTITLNHFFRIQTILDTSEAIKETRPQYQRHVVFFSPWIDGEEIETSSNEPRLLEMVIKITLDGKEIYLQTIYESSIKEYQRRKTRGLLLREKVLT